jgi:hypothetical protein
MEKDCLLTWIELFSQLNMENLFKFDEYFAYLP